MGELNLRDAAKRLRLSYRQILRLVKSGALLSRREGRERVVKESDVFRYFKNGH